MSIKLLALATGALTSVKPCEAVAPPRLTLTEAAEFPEGTAAVDVRVSVPEGPLPATANCCVTPVGNPVTLTVGVPDWPLMVTVSVAAAPSCGTTTLVLPRLTETVGVGVGVELPPPPHPVIPTRSTRVPVAKHVETNRHLVRITHLQKNQIA